GERDRRRGLVDLVQEGLDVPVLLPDGGGPGGRVADADALVALGVAQRVVLREVVEDPRLVCVVGHRAQCARPLSRPRAGRATRPAPGLAARPPPPTRCWSPLPSGSRSRRTTGTTWCDYSLALPWRVAITSIQFYLYPVV